MPPVTSPVVRLSELEPGEKACIVRVGGRCEVRRRFLEMGLVRGEEVVVERVAPLGDPVEFLVKGYHLSLRKEEARHIEVTRQGCVEKRWRWRRRRRCGAGDGHGRGGGGGRRWRIW